LAIFKKLHINISCGLYPKLYNGGGGSSGNGGGGDVLE